MAANDVGGVELSSLTAGECSPADALNVFEIPTDGIFEIEFESPCGTCGHPKVTPVSGGVAASGTYRISAVDDA